MQGPHGVWVFFSQGPACMRRSRRLWRLCTGGDSRASSQGTNGGRVTGRPRGPGLSEREMGGEGYEAMCDSEGRGGATEGRRAVSDRAEGQQPSVSSLRLKEKMQKAEMHREEHGPEDRHQKAGESGPRRGGSAKEGRPCGTERRGKRPSREHGEAKSRARSEPAATSPVTRPVKRQVTRTVTSPPAPGRGGAPPGLCPVPSPVPSQEPGRGGAPPGSRRLERAQPETEPSRAESPSDQPPGSTV